MIVVFPAPRNPVKTETFVIILSAGSTRGSPEVERNAIYKIDAAKMDRARYANAERSPALF